jgi:hypothetical protein
MVGVVETTQVQYLKGREEDVLVPSVLLFVGDEEKIENTSRRCVSGR